MNQIFKPRIKLVTHSFSGCSGRTLYDRMPVYISNKYDVELIESEFYTEMKTGVHESEIVVTTHCTHTPKKGQINVELWHGFGPKTARLMEQDNSSIRSSLEYQLHYFEHINAICYFSKFCSSILNGGFAAPGYVYQTTGMPRNDVLMDSNGRKNLEALYDADFSEKKIIFYTPTWREQYVNIHKSDGSRSWNNIFGLNQFDEESFADFLKINNIKLIIKLHPIEEKLVQEHLAHILLPGMHLMSDELLRNSGIQFYEILNSADMLISDYSSIAMDYLLLDRPMMFMPVDIESYESSRGIWLTPYEFWSPGPIVFSQEQLENEIIQSLADPSYYSKQRTEVKSIVHQYQDNGSTERVWEVIDSLWEGNMEREIENPSTDMVLLRNTIKKEINELCNSMKLKEARELIYDYESQIKYDVDILILKATIFYLENDLVSAIWELREAYIEAPRNPEVLFYLGFMYKAYGDLPRSAYYFNRLLQSEGSDGNYDLLKDQAREHLAVM